MQTNTNTLPIDIELAEQIANILFVVGAILVFQWWLEVLFIIGLVALALGSLGTLVVQVMKRRPSARIVEQMTVLGMMVGILGMFQSWQIWAYENGFYLLLISTLGFIVVSHIGSQNDT